MSYNYQHYTWSAAVVTINDLIDHCNYSNACLKSLVTKNNCTFINLKVIRI